MWFSSDFFILNRIYVVVMRLGKKKEKERDSEPRSQNVDGISRLICSAKAGHSAPMRGRLC